MSFPHRNRLAFYRPTVTAGSWWIDVERRDFTRRVRDEHEQRMSNNRESRMVNQLTLATMQPPAPGSLGARLWRAS